MRKAISLLTVLLLVLSVLPASAGDSLGTYAWRDFTVELASVGTEPKFIPDGVGEDEYCVEVVINLEEMMRMKIDVMKELTPEVKVSDPAGNVYEVKLPLLWQSNVGPDHLDLVYVIPKSVQPEELTVTIGPEPEAEPAQVPAEFVGTWKGKGDFGIELTVNILEDGSGSYAFEQRGYREEGEFSFSFTDSTFSLTNPNAALMTGAEGTYTLEDGVLTMDITSTLSNGSTYSYTVALTKID